MSLKKIPQKPTKQVCAQCEKDKPLTEYYTTKDTFFFPCGKIPVCKICLNSAWDNEEVNGFDLFKNTLRIINKPLIGDLYKGVPKDYIRQINSLSQYKEETFVDSDLFDERKSLSVTKKIKVDTLSENEFLDLQDFFGDGYEEKDYIYLQSEYEDYLNRYEVDSKTLENLIKEICLTQLDIRKKRAKGDKVDSQQKTLQDLLGSSNLKPVQESAASSISEQETMGTLIKKWENDRPIPEPDDAWKDVDGIGKYIRTFFLGHLAKLFGKENSFQDEYDDTIGEFTVKPPRRDDD